MAVNYNSALEFSHISSLVISGTLPRILPNIMRGIIMDHVLDLLSLYFP